MWTYFSVPAKIQSTPEKHPLIWGRVITGERVIVGRGALKAVSQAHGLPPRCHGGLARPHSASGVLLFNLCSAFDQNGAEKPESEAARTRRKRLQDKARGGGRHRVGSTLRAHRSCFLAKCIQRSET